MRVFRIADRRAAWLDTTGARMAGGRWNSPGRGVVYAAETFAGAVLEVLVHSNLGRVPPLQVLVTIEIPDAVRVETVAAAAWPGWDREDARVSRAFGDRWLEEGRAAVLLVPSLVTRGRECNVVLNPEHCDFVRITVSRPEPVEWDTRLFRVGQG